VTLEEVGTNVVATGSGTLDLTDLTFGGVSTLGGEMMPSNGTIFTGPASGAAVEDFGSVIGPTSFGSGSGTGADSGSGDLVGIASGFGHVVPFEIVVGEALSDTSTYDNQTFSSLGVTPGTYEWTWGTGADADSFTLQIGAVPAPLIGHGLPVLLAVGGLLFGAKLLEGSERHGLQSG
jgi:hypothetical protein